MAPVMGRRAAAAASPATHASDARTEGTNRKEHVGLRATGYTSMNPSRDDLMEAGGASLHCMIGTGRQCPDTHWLLPWLELTKSVTSITGFPRPTTADQAV